MASCKTDFLYSLSPFGKSLIIHKWKGQHVWNRLDLSQRTYVGFSQWAATCNTKRYNIQTSAVIWIVFMVIKFIYYFVSFNSWEILFASLIRIFSRIAKNTIGKIQKQWNLEPIRYIHVLNTFAPVSGNKRNKMLSFGQAALNDLVEIWFNLPGCKPIRQVRFRSYLPSNKI